MPPGKDHTEQIFYEAVRVLAGGNASLRGRLADAYLHHLTVLNPTEVPAEMRERFEILRGDLTGAGGSIHDVLAAWPDEDVSRLAKEIVDFFFSITMK